ncbi:MAG: sulfurtransferase TusA family protein [Ectothiorhodospiraceae bacterium]|jgi:tRNA 2-thiouridine synthesizing protein A|nr:sulfurtransferase TusA family protein [Ectothiorhodospiraceae bacterium]
MNHDHLLDIRGLCCSAPVIRLGREFRTFDDGAVVLTVSDKCSMLNDIPAWCRMTGNALLQQDETDGLFRFWIRKRSG